MNKLDDSKMNHETFQLQWLPEFLGDFQKLSSDEKEETIKALIDIMGPKEKWLLQTALPDMLFRDFIIDLPSEILENILNYLTFEDLINCCLVSKSWNKYLSSLSAVWRWQAFKLGMNINNYSLEDKIWKNLALTGKKLRLQLKNRHVSWSSLNLGTLKKV